MIDHFESKSNNNGEDINNKLNLPLTVDGGKVIIERLLRLFNFRNRVELSSVLSLSTGRIATWQTREKVPFELLIRIHLSTDVDLDFLLFGKNEEKQNVLKLCSPPNQIPDFATINQNLKSFRFSLSQLPNYDGGKVIIDRLVDVTGARSKLGLCRLTGINEGTLHTWQTRHSTPFELLARVHLATGIPMLFLCFGKHEYPSREPNKLVEPTTIDVQNPTATADIYKLKKFSIAHGNKIQVGDYRVSHDFLKDCGLAINSDFVVKVESSTYFINTDIKTVTKGLYLLSVNDAFQIGELRQLPDGKTYFYDDGDKYPINEDTTKIHGKVVSILQNV